MPGAVDVALDVRRGVHASHSGIGRYVFQLAAELEHRDDVHLRRVSSSQRTFASPVRKAVWDQLGVLPAAVRGQLFHAPYYEISPLAGRRLVLNVHDLDTVDAPHRYSQRSRTYLNALLPLLVRRATRIIVPSQHTAERLEARFGAAGKADVIPYGVSDAFAAVRAPSAGERFVIYTGGYAHRKDIPSLLAVFAQIVDAGYPGELVLTGGPWPGDEVLAQLPLGVRSRVRFTGRVDDAALADLYATADLLLYPSLMEGFGFPVVEAMAAGCPVVSTTAGSIPELAGSAAILVEPGDRAGLLDAVHRVLADGGLRERLIDHGRLQAADFSWERAAALTVETYRAALDSSPGPSQRPRRSPPRPELPPRAAGCSRPRS
jgi:glycosyltransferase involved in cell wall biosynthesis